MNGIILRRSCKKSAAVNRRLAYAILNLLLLSLIQNVFAESHHVKVGVVLHLTGDLAMPSAAFREGLELALDEINGQGGIGGSPMELLIEDGRNTPSVSQTAVRKLLSTDKVSILILSSYLDIVASSPIIEREQVPALILWDSSPEIDALGEYSFAMGPWTPSSGEVSARFAKDRLGAKTAVVVTNPDSWSETVARFFRTEFLKGGGVILDDISLNPADADFRAVLTRIKKLSPDLIYSPIVNNLVPFYSQIKRLGLSVPVVSSSIIAPEHIAQAPEAFEGVYQTNIRDPDSSAFIEMTKKYRAKFKKEVSLPWFVAVGYDALQVVGAVLRQGASGSEQMKKALYQLNEFKGTSGTISFNPRGSSPQYEKMDVCVHGKFVPAE